MSDRKYRQRGYQDGERPDRPPAQREPTPREFRVPNMPGFKNVVRCSRCGQQGAADVKPTDTCEGCGSDRRACAQCTWFDPGQRFECAKPISARVAPKDVRNDCEHFQARLTVERETGSPAVSNARDAFDDLFK
jgi:hypothetical protein